MAWNRAKKTIETQITLRFILSILIKNCTKESNDKLYIIGAIQHTLYNEPLIQSISENICPYY